MSDGLHSREICAKNVRCGRANQRKIQKKICSRLGGGKVGMRTAAEFISPIAPVTKIIVQFAELAPFGEGTLKLKAM